MLTLSNTGEFISNGKPLEVYAIRAKSGRWRYMAGSRTGALIGSGMTPTDFAKKFWSRTDFTDTEGV